ncbi:type II toxin-antitoxin system HicA family toxin [Marinomonas agarivorans]|nr:type II toxin-antitoxin system HicA family toxin [Marinomonas agarivorans]
MSKTEKLLNKLRYAEHEYTWKELVTLLTAFGFQQLEGAGSRVKFVKGDLSISLHKPHPEKEIKRYALRHIKHILKSEGYL